MRRSAAQISATWLHRSLFPELHTLQASSRQLQAGHVGTPRQRPLTQPLCFQGCTISVIEERKTVCQWDPCTSCKSARHTRKEYLKWSPRGKLPIARILRRVRSGPRRPHRSWGPKHPGARSSPLQEFPEGISWGAPCMHGAPPCSRCTAPAPTPSASPPWDEGLGNPGTTPMCCP